jgi:hypothetical protein
MSDQPKSKMISLRLSAEEYQALRALYPSYGARNVSDFARLAMKRVIGHPLPATSASFSKINEMDERLAALEEKFALLLAQEKYDALS